jgi:hypothetical protein
MFDLDLKPLLVMVLIVGFIAGVIFMLALHWMDVHHLQLVWK